MSLQMASLRAWFWSSCLAGMIPGESRSSRFCSGWAFAGQTFPGEGGGRGEGVRHGGENELCRGPLQIETQIIFVCVTETERVKERKL